VVNRPKFDSGHATGDHAVHGVTAPTADPDHLDLGDIARHDAIATTFFSGVICDSWGE
jgi:hypothetical protein